MWQLAAAAALSLCVRQAVASAVSLWASSTPAQCMALPVVSRLWHQLSPSRFGMTVGLTAADRRHRAEKPQCGSADVYTHCPFCHFSALCGMQSLQPVPQATPQPRRTRDAAEQQSIHSDGAEKSTHGSTGCWQWRAAPVDPSRILCGVRPQSMRQCGR
eukprot:COSAG02_NODE_15801_length_1140_cov_0.835735_1_plen_159_part_00